MIRIVLFILAFSHKCCNTVHRDAKGWLAFATPVLSQDMLQLTASLERISECIFHVVFEFLFRESGIGWNRLSSTCLAEVSGKRLNCRRLLVENTAEIAIVFIGFENTFSRIHNCLLGL